MKQVDYLIGVCQIKYHMKYGDLLFYIKDMDQEHKVSYLASILSKQFKDTFMSIGNQRKIVTQEELVFVFKKLLQFHFGKENQVTAKNIPMKPRKLALTCRCLVEVYGYPCVADGKGYFYALPEEVEYIIRREEKRHETHIEYMSGLDRVLNEQKKTTSSVV